METIAINSPFITESISVTHNTEQDNDCQVTLATPEHLEHDTRVTLDSLLHTELM